MKVVIIDGIEYEPREQAKEKENAPTYLLELQYEALKQENEDLRNELSTFNIAENERIEVFTNDDYMLFEKRLNDWKTQRLELEHQEQLFNIEKKTLNELHDHYKTQFEYQKTQSTKILEMHQKLLDTITQQNKLAIQRNIIEAADKDVINKNTWKTK